MHRKTLNQAWAALAILFAFLSFLVTAQNSSPGVTATPPEKIATLPGFKIELLYSPAKDAEGSWVSMCVDSKGRLIVSGQYDEGLHRITPPAVGSHSSHTLVQKIPINLSSAQGLCWAFDSLYALVTQNAKTPSGLYRARDTNGDDILDQVELLRSLEGGGDHGWHAILPGPDGQSLYAIAGNNTRSPALAGSRVPPHWSEDHLLPRLPDAGGHMKGVLAPGGVVYRVSPDGKAWEMIANGFRNTYDAAFHQNGDLFTYDADMEWDMGTPWYRPTRICLVTRGAEFGWRNGTGKWPAYQPDSLPGVLDIGPGSPTGVAFGYGAKFPPKYQQALYAADWTFGRLYAIHLQPQGAAYQGETEIFLSGIPLPVTDVVISPHDGAMYFITGGWRIQTGLYRVTHQSGGEAVPNAAPPNPQLALRRKLESFHGRRDPAAVDYLWPFLGNSDRYLRFAARTALEWQDPGLWQERALQEKATDTAMNALLALIRRSARDEFHRKANDPVPAPELQSRILRALDRLDWGRLETRQRLDLLRVYAVCFTRLGMPGDPTRQHLLSKLERRFPASSPALNYELCQLLVYLQSAKVAGVALDLVRLAPTQEEQLGYIQSLRMLKTGWSLEQRKDYFRWFHRAAQYRGGASFAGFINMIKTDALATLTAEEHVALRDILEAPPPAATAGFSTLLANRANSTSWTVQSLASGIEEQLGGRDFTRGRNLFGAAGCFQCHRFAGEGGAVGPDLTQAVGRFSARDLLESIIEPSKTISDLYGNVVIAKRDGETITGRIVYLHEHALSVSPEMFNPANTLKVDRKEVLSIEPSKVSPMPEGLLAAFTQDEIFDLVAYILSRGDASHSMFTTPPATVLEKAFPTGSPNPGTE